MDIVINYEEETKEYKVYEPTTDTLIITTNLPDLFIKLGGYLKDSGLISCDLLECKDITYHIDSPTFIAIMQNNVALTNRMNEGPSGFMISNKKFGGPLAASSGLIGPSLKQKSDRNRGKNNSGFGKGSFGKGGFSNSSFGESGKKFGRF